MKTTRLNLIVEGGLVLLFLGLAGAFVFDVWGRIHPPAPLPDAPLAFTNVNTVRLSSRQMVELEQDTSGMQCYGCHKKGEVGGLSFGPDGVVALPEAHKDLIFSRMNCAGCHDDQEGVEIQYNDDGDVIIPAAHQGAVLRHGQSSRNNDCYNCHVSTNLVMLRTVNGQLLELTESNLLCANCHGPTYRNWMIGIHGRFNGYWNVSSPERARVDCTSCHDPHLSAFPSMRPRPAPGPYHTVRSRPDFKDAPTEETEHASHE